jgi:hypothetical protein
MPTILFMLKIPTLYQDITPIALQHPIKIVRTWMIIAVALLPAEILMLPVNILILLIPGSMFQSVHHSP